MLLLEVLIYMIDNNIDDHYDDVYDVDDVDFDEWIFLVVDDI